MHLGEAATEDGEVLAEDKAQPAVDGALARHDRVAGKVLILHPKVHAPSVR